MKLQLAILLGLGLVVPSVAHAAGGTATGTSFGSTPVSYSELMILFTVNEDTQKPEPGSGQCCFFDVVTSHLERNEYGNPISVIDDEEVPVVCCDYTQEGCDLQECYHNNKAQKR